VGTEAFGAHLRIVDRFLPREFLLMAVCVGFGLGAHWAVAAALAALHVVSLG